MLKTIVYREQNQEDLKKQQDQTCIRKFGNNLTNKIDGFPFFHPRKNGSNKENSSFLSNSCSVFNMPTKPKIQINSFSIKNLSSLTYIFPKSISNDNLYSDNPQYVHEYIDEIFSDMLSNLNINKPKSNGFSSTQKDISFKHRNMVIDWLLEVHFRFKLNEETLYLCVNLIDRYLSIVPVKTSELQLVGITCLLIATKFEEIYPPEIRDLEYITDGSCKYQDIINKEREILSVLNFDILTVYSYTLLKRIHFISTTPIKVFHLALYVLECSFFDENSFEFDDFIKALGALYLSKAILLGKFKFPSVLTNLITDNKRMIKSFIKSIVKLIPSLQGKKLSSVQKKFKTEQYNHVGNGYFYEKE